ncbi:MAG TPA: hypothetical protein VMG11_02225 [Steroidobacteraceae bacterium]|nr:hypothetical protein [Steroidobacteraceae bacterium]
MQADIIRRFHAALPQVRTWIDDFLAAHTQHTRKVSTLGFKRLPACFPSELLERAKVASVNYVEFPPVHKFGLPEFAPIQQMQFDGLTFKDTCFIKQGCESEALQFHELIHVVQWSRLGVDKFLLAYGLGLLQFGYAQNPLEEMAYTLQQLFERGTTPMGLMRVIEERSDAIWRKAAPVVEGQSGSSPSG